MVGGTLAIAGVLVGDYVVRKRARGIRKKRRGANRTLTERFGKFNLRTGNLVHRSTRGRSNVSHPEPVKGEAAGQILQCPGKLGGRMVLADLRSLARSLFQLAQGPCLIHPRAPQQVEGHSANLAYQYARG